MIEDYQIQVMRKWRLFWNRIDCERSARESAKLIGEALAKFALKVFVEEKQ